MSSEIKIFSGSSSRNFAQSICDYIGVELGKSEVITFSEGNTFVRIGETVRDKDVYLVQSIGLNPNDEFVEILFWMDAFKRASASSVTAIMPYFSYAKGDKKDEPRVSIRARVCAESIELAGADRIVTMDLHSPQIQGFFKKPVDNLIALPVLCEYIKNMDIDNYVIVSPDAGYAKQAREFSRHLGVSTVIGDKTRKAHDEKAKVLELIGDVKDKNAIIVDDFSISGGTLVELAGFLKERGAKKIFACLSHILLNSKGVEKIENSPIEKVISTDTVINPYVQDSSKVEIVSVAPLFAEAIIRIHNRDSLSILFEKLPERVIRALDLKK
ncbi:ribose-phosphate diphosphokinase [uncultured Tissierella sp.]|jgi:ribose-phosphate pyrophosphokinase|uniref:ribose-phosphate diphosphokinase n=1 Tax=Tissierella sp. TaxID=41274 RepID=UPI002805CF31|nr:ribose-phosphate diphosphokinase [uncultured Tissierella sp.]MDU5080118.1 ribose-phosphate diphosphokinase [Bacillota bacterium]